MITVWKDHVLIGKPSTRAVQFYLDELHCNLSRGSTSRPSIWSFAFGWGKWLLMIEHDWTVLSILPKNNWILCVFLFLCWWFFTFKCGGHTRLPPTEVGCTTEWSSLLMGDLSSFWILIAGNFSIKSSDRYCRSMFAVQDSQKVELGSKRAESKMLI